MKKILMIAACVFCMSGVSAQSLFSTEKSDEGVTFGVRAGLNFANMNVSADNVSLSFDNRTAWHVGVVADIPVVKSFYIQPGFYLQSKGFKTDVLSYDEDLEQLKGTARPLYLEIPVLASLRLNLTNSLQLHINAGPYVAYGIGGKVEAEDEGYSVKEDCFGDDAMKRFDAGLSFGAGLQISRNYYLGFAYELGLTNVMDALSDTGASCKNRNWMISVGYNF